MQAGTTDNRNGVLGTTNQNVRERETPLEEKDTVPFNMRARYPCGLSWNIRSALNSLIDGKTHEPPVCTSLRILSLHCLLS